jgi:hypothetical protein
MKISRQLNTLSYSEYLHLLRSYSRYTDFNSLGLFRSILENEKLTAEQKLEIRDAAISAFPKFFVFLQVKDPWTYRKLTLLGQDFTEADEDRLRDIIELNQQRILADKRIKHRNFGIYSKHSCGYDTCYMNGLMIKQGSLLSEYIMVTPSRRPQKYSTFSKSEQRKQERKSKHQIIQADLDTSER